MKIVLVGIVFLASFSCVNAQTLTRDGDLCELLYRSSEPSEAHKSVNAFAKQVGEILKSEYPSKVLDPSVSLRVFKESGQTLYSLVWSCRVVKASGNDADYYFDRRGTMLYGRVFEDVRRNVNIEIDSSNKVRDMRQAFKGKGKISETFIRDSFSGTSSEGYWYIKEYFLTAPK